MATKTNKTGEFSCQGADGESYRVIEYTQYDSVNTIHRVGMHWSPGVKNYRLTSGAPVNVAGERVFEIVSTGVRLNRGD